LAHNRLNIAIMSRFSLPLSNFNLILFVLQVIKDHYNLIEDKRVFFSEIRDDNPLDCLVKKLNIVRLPLNVRLLVPIYAFLFFVVIIKCL
jgi:hypothetical protein